MFDVNNVCFIKNCSKLSSVYYELLWNKQYLVVNLDLQIRKIEAALEYTSIYLKPPLTLLIPLGYLAAVFRIQKWKWSAM